MSHIQIIDARRRNYIEEEEEFSSFESDHEVPKEHIVVNKKDQAGKSEVPTQRVTIEKYERKRNSKILCRRESEYFSDYSQKEDDCEKSLRIMKQLKIQKQNTDRQRQKLQLSRKQAQDKLLKDLLKQIDSLKRQNIILKEESTKNTNSLLKEIEYLKLSHKQSNEIRKEELKEMEYLKNENKSLRNENDKIQKLMEEVKEINSNVVKQQKVFRDNCMAEKKEKIQQLLKQIGKLKESAHGLKFSLENAHKKVDKLEQFNAELLREIQQAEWKDNFIDLFVDMFIKISDDIDRSWSTKKKVQISWKINKNMVQKAISLGAKLPKVEKNCEHSMFVKGDEHRDDEK